MLARVLLSVSSIAFALSEYDGFRSVYETARIIEADGYRFEVHGVLTTDGYMLEMHRIPYKKNETTGPPDRPVVFLMHGLLAASSSFIAIGPTYAIAYNLADAGFDVWMGNARGNKYSRRHINLDPDSSEDRHNFFDFSWEEIGYHDVASMIDFVLMYTNNEKLHYIGHSQGGTAFLVLNSMKPDYNDRIISAHLLAGVGYMKHFPNRLLRGLAMFTNTIYTLALRLNIVELFPPVNSSTPLSDRRQNDYEDDRENFDFECGFDEICRPIDFCTGNPKQKEMCELFGLEEIMSTKILDNILSGFEIGGAALKQVAHYGQNIQDKAFRRWDYGAMENFQRYGSHEPPIYNISQIGVQTIMHYTVSDNLLDESDVLAMCETMPHCEARKVARESFSHVDFVAASDMKELVTEYIIEQIRVAHKNYLANLPAVTVAPWFPPDNSTVADSSSLLVPSIFMKLFITVHIMLICLL